MNSNDLDEKDLASKVQINEFKTNIPFIMSRFYIHDKLKSSSGFSNHFIVEDLKSVDEINDTDDNSSFYYLKQTFFKDKNEYFEAFNYYQKIHQYSKAIFSKNDMVKLHSIFSTENKDDFELVLLFDYGEPDRIDMDSIESTHINKFLKNICSLLIKLKEFDNLYNSNIEIPNIVLVNSELKISGFKARYLQNANHNSWKVMFIRNYSYFRLDVFLTGILWLRFLKVQNIDLFDEQNANLNEVLKKAQELLTSTELCQQSEIIRKLIDPVNYPLLTIEEVMFVFDENNLLENINTSKQYEKKESTFENDMNFPLEYNTFDKFELNKSKSYESNLFLKPLHESVIELNNNQMTVFPKKEISDIMFADYDFTLKQENSVIDVADEVDELIKSQYDKINRDRNRTLDLKDFAQIDRNYSQRNIGFEKLNLNKIANARKMKSDRKLIVVGLNTNELRANNNQKNVKIVNKVDEFELSSNSDSPLDEFDTFKNQNKIIEKKEINNEIIKKNIDHLIEEIKSPIDTLNITEKNESIKKIINDTIDESKTKKTSENESLQLEFALNSNIINSNKFRTNINEKLSRKVSKKKMEMLKIIVEKNPSDLENEESDFDQDVIIPSPILKEVVNKNTDKFDLRDMPDQISTVVEQKSHFEDVAVVESPIILQDVIKLEESEAHRKAQIESSIETENREKTDELVDYNKISEEFKRHLKELKSLMIDFDFDKIIQKLEEFPNQSSAIEKVELKKLMSILFYKIEKKEESKEELKSALEILKSIPESDSNKKNVQSILISIAVIEYGNRNFIQVIEVLQCNDIDKEQLTHEHYQMMADSFIELSQFLNAAVSFDRSSRLLAKSYLSANEIKRLINLRVQLIHCLCRVSAIEMIFSHLDSSIQLLNVYESKMHSIEEFTLKVLAKCFELKNDKQTELIVIQLFSNQTTHLIFDYRDDEVSYLVSLILKLEAESKLTMIEICISLANLIKDEGLKDRILFSIYFQKAIISTDVRNFKQALIEYDALEKLFMKRNLTNETEMKTAILNAQICAIKLNQFEQAECSLERYWKSNEFDLIFKIQISKLLAKVYFYNNKFDKSKALLDELIQLNSSEPLSLKYLLIYNICVKKLNLNSIENQCLSQLQKINDKTKSEYINIVCLLTFQLYADNNQFNDADRLIQDQVKSYSIEMEFNNIRTKIELKMIREAISLLKQLVIKNESRNSLIFKIVLVIINRIEIDSLDFDELKTETLDLINMINENELNDMIAKRVNLISSELESIRQQNTSTLINESSSNLKVNSTTKSNIIQESETISINNTNLTIETKDDFKETSRKSPSQSDMKSNSKKEITNVKKTSNAKLTESAVRQTANLKINIRKNGIESETKKSQITETTKSNKKETKKSSNLVTINSSEILQKSNVRKSKCICFEFKHRNQELVKLIKLFFTELKSTSKTNDSISKAYVNLKAKLVICKLKLSKFAYIDKLMKIVESHNKRSELNKKELDFLFEEIIASKDICMHDIKKVALFFENVIDSALFILFLEYLDSWHKGLLKSLFKQQILPSFQKLYEEFITSIYKSAENSHKNFALMHYLDLKPVTKVKLEELDKFNKASMNYLLDEKNRELIIKHILPTELARVYLSKAIKQLFASITECDDGSEGSLILQFKNSVSEILKRHKISRIQNRFYVYEFYACLLTLQNRITLKTSAAIFEVLLFLELKLNVCDMYHFAVVCSAVGNFLFENKLFENCLKAKQLAHGCLKKITDVEMCFPVYYPQIEPTALMFSILSFNLVCKIEMEEIEKARLIIDKMKLIKLESKSNEFEKKLIFAFFESIYGKLMVAKDLVDELDKELVNLVDRKENKEMFAQVLRKMKILMSKSNRN